MGTRYNIRASSGGESKCALHRYDREKALEAANVLLSAFGEETIVEIEWTLTSENATDLNIEPAEYYD